MPFCQACGKAVEAEWKLCPFCSHSLDSGADISNIQDSVVVGDINKSKFSNVVSDLITDTAVAGDVHQNITINDVKDIVSGCPSCGSKNVPVMVCMSSDCEESFCEFCYKRPWVNIVEPNDNRLSANSFSLTSKRTDYGPYCEVHGKELIDEYHKRRSVIVQDKISNYEEEIAKLSVKKSELEEPINLINSNLDYWGDMHKSASDQHHLLNIVTSNIDYQKQKKELLEEDAKKYQELRKKYIIAEISLISGWLLAILSFFIIPSSIEMFRVWSSTLLIIIWVLFSIVIWDNGFKSRTSAVTHYALSVSIVMFLPFLFYPGDINRSNLRGSIAIIIYFVLNISVYFLQRYSGVIAINSFAPGKQTEYEPSPAPVPERLGKHAVFVAQQEKQQGGSSGSINHGGLANKRNLSNALAKLTFTGPVYINKIKLKYKEAIFNANLEMMDAIREETIFNVHTIPDKLDPNSKTASLKMLIEKYNLNWEQSGKKLAELRVKSELIVREISIVENNMNSYYEMMMGSDNAN